MPEFLYFECQICYTVINSRAAGKPSRAHRIAVCRIQHFFLVISNLDAPRLRFWQCVHLESSCFTLLGAERLAMSSVFVFFSAVGVVCALVGAAGAFGGLLDVAALWLSADRASLLGLVSTLGFYACLLGAARFLGRLISGSDFPTVVDSFWVVGPFVLALSVTDGTPSALAQATNLITAGGMAGDAMRAAVQVLCVISELALLTIPLQILATVVGFISLLGGNWGGKLTWVEYEKPTSPL
jgi:hypothetical protein